MVFFTFLLGHTDRLYCHLINHIAILTQKHNILLSLVSKGYFMPLYFYYKSRQCLVLPCKKGYVVNYCLFVWVSTTIRYNSPAELCAFPKWVCAITGEQNISLSAPTLPLKS